MILKTANRELILGLPVNIRYSRINSRYQFLNRASIGQDTFYLQYAAFNSLCILKRTNREKILDIPAISDIRELFFHRFEITLYLVDSKRQAKIACQLCIYFV